MQTREGCFQATQKVAGGVVFIERLQVKSHFATLPSLGEVVTDDAVHVIAAASNGVSKNGLDLMVVWSTTSSR